VDRGRHHHRAAQRLADLVWSRSHGEEKRELVVREILGTAKAIFSA